MPTRPSFRRLWCVSCKEWELFETQFHEHTPSTLNCVKCKTPLDENVVLGDIPEDKILEQRARYKESKRREFKGMMNILTYLSEPSRIFGEVGATERSIIEHSAGQIEIDEEKARVKKEERKALYEERVKYAKVERNELCPCGSGKKFKRCHISIM